MLISYAIANYTNGERFELKHVWGEMVEMLEEVVKRNLPGIKEEWQDVGVYFQCWLYWRFKIDGEAWQWTSDSWKKFMDRIHVWQQLYEYVGLDRNISRFCGNYHRIEKVIKQLGSFGINSNKATEAYNAIVK